MMTNTLAHKNKFKTMVRVTHKCRSPFVKFAIKSGNSLYAFTVRYIPISQYIKLVPHLNRKSKCVIKQLAYYCIHGNKFYSINSIDLGHSNAGMNFPLLFKYKCPQYLD